MISIIIPLYNQAKKLDKCLEGIKNQTYNNYEIIVVNDRSLDRLSWLIGKYKKVFGIKIEFIHNSMNHGAPYSRNKGFLKSKGERVLFLDADVELKPEALELMVKALKEHPEASYVYPSHRFGRKLFRVWEFDAAKLKEMPYIHTTALIRREHLPALPWDENLRRLQDWDLFLTMLENGKTGHWLDKVLFTVSPGGTMSNWVPSFFYRLFPFLPKVRKYNAAVRVIKEKHGLL
jgi:glycosyltransferase involved in cell wall biosynthesis